jgi:hypothetical protein
MTLDQAKAIIADVNPALFVVDQTEPGRDHVLSIRTGEAVGTTNYDLRTLDDEILRSLVRPA